MIEQQAKDPWAAAANYNPYAHPQRPSALRRAIAGASGLLVLAMAPPLVLATRSGLLLIALVATGVAAYVVDACWRSGDLPSAYGAAVGPAGIVLAMMYCAFLDQCFNGVTAELHYICGNASLGVPFVVAFLAVVGATVCGAWSVPAAQRAHPTALGRGAIALGVAFSLLGARATQRALHGKPPGNDVVVRSQRASHVRGRGDLVSRLRRPSQRSPSGIRSGPTPRA